MESEKVTEKPKETKETKETSKGKENDKEKEKPTTTMASQSQTQAVAVASVVDGNAKGDTVTAAGKTAVAVAVNASGASSSGGGSNSNGAEKKKRSAPIGKSNQRPRPTKRRRKQREEGAPKLPLTGYVRYMNFRRDSVKQEFPEKTSVDHTKIIADEWNHMSEELKKPYLQAAEIDKERYNQQISEYNRQKKAQASNENVHQNNLKSSSNSSSTNSATTTTTTTITIPLSTATIQNSQVIANHTTKKPFRRYGNDSIPIFTDEFLEHNKVVDLELRTLRKSNIDYEQQNSVLEKHIENMKFGVEKMETENSELIQKNILLETYLRKLRTKLAQAFSSLSIPSEPNGATMTNIDKYMAALRNMVSSNSHGPASLNKAKDIIRKLDLQIQL